MNAAFASIGSAIAAIHGEAVSLTLSDGTVVAIRAIWQSRHIETVVGDYGADLQVMTARLDVVRRDWLARGRVADDLYGATFEKTGKLYSISNPLDDMRALIHCTCVDAVLDDDL